MLTSVSTDAIAMTLEILNRKVLIIEIVICIAIFAVAMVISRFLTRPFDKVTGAINEVKEGFTNEALQVPDYLAFGQALIDMGIIDTYEWERLVADYISENEINEYWEGKIGQVTITTHERSAEARNKCIRIKGIKCAVCGFDFESTYGELGKGFIHIHHVNPISNMKVQYEIDVEHDLFPVCPNCHAMLHRKKGSTLSIEELKQIIQQNNG